MVEVEITSFAFGSVCYFFFFVAVMFEPPEMGFCGSYKSITVTYKRLHIFKEWCAPWYLLSGGEKKKKKKKQKKHPSHQFPIQVKSFKWY